MAQSKPCPCCSTDCIKKKVKTRLSWVLIMLLLGTCDVFINWVNFADLTSPELGRGLVLGPPPSFMWILLLTFTILGTILYVPETLNTLSVFFRESGATAIPIIYEQLITLPAEQIPLAAINYFISRCRRQYGSTVQTLCGTTSIVFIFVRIVWYAHMEGKLLQRGKDDAKMKKGAFMAICALYAASMAFPIMNWRSQPGGQINSEEHLKTVSLFLLKGPPFESMRFVEKRIDRLLKSQGRDLHHPALLESVADVYDDYVDGGHGVLAQYHCDSNATFLPAECPTEGYLLFRFLYAAYTEAGPYGEIVYNYAFFPSAPGTETAGSGGSGGGASGETGGAGASQTCIPSKGDLQEGWKLFYLTYAYKHHDGFMHALVSSPWEGCCTTPRPWFDSSIRVCPSADGGLFEPASAPPRVLAEAAMLTSTNRTYRHLPREPPPITDGTGS